MSSVIFVLSVLVLPGGLAAAATYYMATTGNDATGTGAVSSPFLTLRHAFTRMMGGDTLVIEDGTYTGISNRLDQNYRPPTGTSTAYTIIKARNDGAVIFDGENTNTMFEIAWNSGTTNVYWQFEGIIWARSPNTPNVGVWHAGYIKMFRCGAYDAGDGNTINFNFGTGSDHILLENCYAWGSGRYKFLFGQATNSIIRNSVGRLDRTNAPAEPIAVFTIYSSTDVEVQNSIAIDSDQNAFYSYAEMDGGFQTPSTSGNADRINFTNCITLNSRIGALATSGNSGYRAADVHFNNCVFWNATKPDGSANMIRGLRTQVANSTFGAASQINYAYFVSYDGIGYNNDTTVKDTIFYGITARSGAAEPYVLNDVEDGDYNSFFGNTNNYQSNTIAGAHDRTNINPIYNASTNPTGALKYITRIESGSNLAGQGENGADIGANIKTLIGAPGTLWGEPGYNTDTGVSMWPFPNEDLIKRKMKAYNAGGVSGNRGFAADGNGLYGGPITLTSYIWEYLGNPCPADICNYTQTFHLADTNQNNKIEMKELITFIGKWKINQAVLSDVLDAMGRWLRGD